MPPTDSVSPLAPAAASSLIEAAGPVRAPEGTGAAKARSAATQVPAASSRKYPTLARMTAAVTIAPVEDQEEQPARSLLPATPLGQDAHGMDGTGARERPVPGPAGVEPTKTLTALAAKDALARSGRPQRDRLDPVAEEEDEEPRTLFSRPRPLESANIVLAVAAAHAALVALAALIGAMLLITQHPLTIWLWLFAGVTGAGGWLAYAIAQNEDRRPFAGGVLLASQLGVLAWALALLGPRASLLALVPALLLLGLRMAGRPAATIWVLAVCALYCVALVLGVVIGVQPALRLAPGAATLLDAGLVCAGLLLTLAGMSRMVGASVRAERLARARQHEAKLLRARVVALQRRSAEDAERIYALAEATLRGEQRAITPLDGALGPAVERLRAAAERVAELRTERVEHRRVGAALVQLTRALERGWLGLRWKWPAPSGTAVDDVVALLRAPSPRDPRAAIADESPSGLLPIPTTDPDVLARRQSGPLPVARRASPSLPGEFARARTHPDPRPPKATAPLRWEEWNEWRDWQRDDEG
jgi:hypothetical protein